MEPLALMGCSCCYPDAGHVLSGALAAASLCQDANSNRIGLKIDQRPRNKAERQEGNGAVGYVSPG